MHEIGFLNVIQSKNVKSHTFSLEMKTVERRFCHDLNRI